MSESAESTLRTFRLDADVIKGLEEEAKRQGATVNGLACRVLKNYVKIRAKLEPFGIVCLAKSDIVELINSLDADALAKTASKIGGLIAKEIIIQLYGELSPENFKQFLETVICSFGDWAAYSEDVKEGYYEIRLGHNMGQKWSIFLRNYVDAALMVITGKKTEFKYVSNYSVIFNLKIR
ncbi:MAG: hypothetical protein FJZ49_00575 [Candidatus Verstraetearchaeota archaeon]|nr:hypothetical protein [Candidatus Verstraetearchaeota archaeon]